MTGETIAIVGCGTLGSRLAELLQQHDLLLFDHDTVSEGNLSTQRFARDELGVPKAMALAQRLRYAKAHMTFIDRTNLSLLSEASIVCDCTDNIYTRTLLNRWCLRNGVPLAHAAAGPRHGVTAVFTGNPCLECVYEGKAPVEDCRGRDLDPELATRLAEEQARLVEQELSGESDGSMMIVSDTVRQVTVDRTCEVCASKPELPQEDFYMSWCIQAGCLSAKPLSRKERKEQELVVDGVRVRILGDGEIRFVEPIEVDEARRIAQRING